MTRLLPVLLCLIAAGARGDETSVLDKDFRIMMAWFPGVYDNQEQVYFEASKRSMRRYATSAFTTFLSQ